MKTQDRWLMLLVLTLLGGHSLYSSFRLHRLEGRIEQLQQTSITHSLAGNPTYTFDDSFIHYFGPQGVAEVERALRILRTPRIEPRPKSQGEDWNMPLHWNVPLEWRGHGPLVRDEI